MNAVNYKGFSVIPMRVEDFIKAMGDKETFEILKVDHLTFIYRTKTGDIYALGEDAETVENRND